MSNKQKSSLRISNNLKIYKYTSLANFTTWRVGGSAEWFAEPSTINEIEELIAWASSKKISCTIIGAGSNLLINDCGVKGLVVCLRKLHGHKINKDNEFIEVLGGENIPSIARRAAKEGLKGLEWAVGIPGTMGGASVMNAGAQGGSISDLLESVKVLPMNGDQSFELNQKELNYSYRKSRLQYEKLIVISAKLKLEPGHDSKQLLEATNLNLQKRINTQPYEQPSCGSVFRNPEHNKAGQLIEDIGLKGFCIGGAEISRKHANFIVNKNNATAKDINDLINHIQDSIQNCYGIKLHTEVKRLGFDISI